MKNQITQTIKEAIYNQSIVGAVVMVAKDGKIIYEHADGFFDREAETPMFPEAIFRIASVTKLYVAVATMILVSKGKMKLDDSVDKFLPYFKPAFIDGSSPTITIRQLLNHTSGLSYSFLEPEGGSYQTAGVSDGMDITDITLEENLKRLSTVPLKFLPGSSWLYSISFDVLGAVLEKVEQTSLSDIIRTMVTEPLGLKNTGFEIKDPKSLATAYVNGNPTPHRMQHSQNVPAFEGMADIKMSPERIHQKNAFPSGGAGMVGTAKDLLILLENLRQDESSILSKHHVEEMSRNQTKNLEIGGWPGWNYGLGFSVLNDSALANTPESNGTWRWGGAYGHSWFVDPVKKLVVVAFTNTALEGMSGGGRFPMDLRNAVYSKD